MYKYLALLEKPVEDKFEQVINYRKVLGLLKKEKEMLEEQMKEERKELEREQQEGDRLQSEDEAK